MLTVGYHPNLSAKYDGVGISIREAEDYLREVQISR
jgi:hypothetical protein